jgi:hypothetical protein
MLRCAKSTDNAIKQKNVNILTSSSLQCSDSMYPLLPTYLLTYLHTNPPPPTKSHTSHSGIGIEADAVGIGISSSSISVRNRSTPVPDWGNLIPVPEWIRHRHFFRSGLTGCRTVRQSGIFKNCTRVLYDR